jgi:uncharacterized OB-fold protein
MASASAGEYKRPLPPMHGLARTFYDYCKKHELRFQRCSQCGLWRHIPRDMCAQCGSFDYEWTKSSGKGKVFTWSTTDQTMLPSFADAVPYSIVVVELDEGLRIATWVVDVPVDQLQIGMPVEVVFDDVTPEVTLPKFRRRAQA